MPIRKILVVIIFTITMSGAIGLHDINNLLWFIDFPSLLLVLGLVIAGTLWSFSVSQILDSVKLIFAKPTLSEQQASLGSRIFIRMSELAIGAGMIGTLIGVIKMLENMDDPSALGPAMAVALLTLFYSIVLGEIVFRSIANDFRSQIPSLLHRDHQQGRLSMHLPLWTILVVGGCFVVLWASTLL